MPKLKAGLYRHYKGNLYEVIGTARHSETLEEFALYRALASGETENIWVRPLGMFLENVKVDGLETPRFCWVDSSLQQ